MTGSPYPPMVMAGRCSSAGSLVGNQQAALARLLYAVRQPGGCAVLCGPGGTGVTTVLGRLAAALEQAGAGGEVEITARLVTAVAFHAVLRKERLKFLLKLISSLGRKPTESENQQADAEPHAIVLHRMNYVHRSEITP